MTRVLVAEDDEGMAEFLEHVLRTAGYEPLVCRDGAEAWERLEREGADLAVLDVNMPRLSGFELCDRIRHDALRCRMPVLMLTVRNKADDLEEGYQTGADDYLPKPFSIDVLIARLRALERRLLHT
jgi:DNA-binding response OmpR family regulator